MNSLIMESNIQYNYPDTVFITGSRRVSGRIKIAGSKIAAIPIMAATILSQREITIENVPNLKDIRVLIYLLNQLGSNISWVNSVVKIDNSQLESRPLPADLITSVHGTIYLIPTLLVRFGEVLIVRTHGGCQIGERPIEHILDVLRSLGANVSLNGDKIIATASHLIGTSMSAHFSKKWDKYRSGATKAFLLASVSAKGKSSLKDAYTRASITELVRFLKMLGAEITGEGTSNIEIVESKLGGGLFSLAGDYLEALTFIACVAACGGELIIDGLDISHCKAELDLFQEMGVILEYKDDSLVVKQNCLTKSVVFTTLKIDTDIQPIIATALTLSNGQSKIQEVVWENRFGYIHELKNMGANLKTVGEHELIIDGVDYLSAANVHAKDLRAAAALLIAAAAAKGNSKVSGLSHLERGYCDFIKKLVSIGVDIREG